MQLGSPMLTVALLDRKVLFICRLSIYDACSSDPGVGMNSGHLQP